MIKFTCYQAYQEELAGFDLFPNFCRLLSFGG